ncbi:MAG: YihY/virulence factor BrkB family protein [Bauldia sp.]
MLWDALNHFNYDDGWAMASHVSLSVLMALFPFLIFVATLAGFIGNKDLADRVADILFATWPKDVAEPIAAQVHDVLTTPRGGLLAVSIVVTVYLASNGVEAVRTALNRAYRATETRWFYWRRLQSVFFVIIGAVASLALAFLSLLGPLMVSRLSGVVPALAPLLDILSPARLGATGFVLVVVLTASHLLLPASRPGAWALWPGILLTLVLWVLSAAIFGYYIERFSNYVATYAGLAGVVAALFFLYIVSVLMLFGAEFNAAIQRLRDGKLG